MAKYLGKDTKERVHDLLVKYPSLRDDYHRLVANFYSELVKAHNEISDNPIVTWQDYLKWYTTDFDIPRVGAIERMSRKLQEEIPSLRGEFWEERQRKATSVKQEIRDFNV